MSFVESAEVFLGSPQKRYFGEGHRSSYYTVYRTYIKNGLWGALAKVSQTGNWSTKNGVSLKRHLTTIDGLILAVRSIELYFEQTGVTADTGDLLLVNFDIRAGQEAVLDLVNIGITITKLDTLANEHIIAQTIVGNMRIQLEFIQAVHENNGNPGHSNLEKYRYIDNHLQYRNQQITNIEIDEDLTQVQCNIINRMKKSVCFTGIQSHHDQKVSLIEWIISVAQVGEILAYSYDDIDRFASNNLWMRSLKIEHNASNGWINLNQNFQFHAKIVRSKLLRLSNRTWRTLVMEGHDDLGTIHITTHLAHQISESNMIGLNQKTS